MSKYVMVHPVGPGMDEAAAAPIAKAIKANCTPDAYWIRSTYLPEEGKLYCEWDAKNPDAIRAVIAEAAKIVPQPPIEGVYMIGAAINGEDFR
jgi:hypothetical protein